MKNTIDKITEVILILLGLFIAYQLIKKIFGGSWQTEGLIIATLIFNLGISWKLNSGLGKLSAKLEGHIDWHKGKDSNIKS